MKNEDINKVKLKQREVIEHFCCEECSEEYLFKMKDNEHEFYMGMKTILQCLSIMEQERIVPQLPNDWWIALMNRYKEKSF